MSAEPRHPSAIVRALEAQAAKLVAASEEMRTQLRDRALPVLLRVKAGIVFATSQRLLDETARVLRRARALTGEETN